MTPPAQSPTVVGALARHALHLRVQMDALRKRVLLDEAHKAVKLVKSAAVWQVRSYIACAARLLLCTAIPPSSAHVGVVLTCCVLHASSEHGDYVC